MRSKIIVLFVAAAAHFLANDNVRCEQLFVGVAQSDITPPVGFRTGGGYGEQISTGIDDPLFAKAVVLRQGSVAMAIVENDLLSVPPDLSTKARRKASHVTGIPFEHIVIAATHNHGSPEYWGSLRDIAHEAAVHQHGNDPHETIDYHQRLVDAWVAAIGKAADSMQPSTIEMTVAQQRGLAFNRRFHMQDGSVRFNPGAGNPNIVRPAGPVDEDLPFILFRSQDSTRQPIASLTTFAMHTAVHGGTTFSADFPAVLQIELRQRFGGDFVSVFAEGTAGDINHIDVTNQNQLRGRPEVRRIGESLATTIQSQLETIQPLRNISLAAVTKTVHAPFHKVSEDRYQEARQQLQNQKATRLPFLTLVAAWRDCHRYRYTQLFDDKKPLEVQTFRLNDDNAIVTLPHEVFVEIGLAIKATSPFRNTVVISLANDVDYYIPTRRAFEEGSYEVTTCPLDPGCGEILLEGARRCLEQLKRE